MRITSGILRNRQFAVPKQEVRPTKERVREAIFSSLGGRCDGLTVLDLFAGAGGLGLEAWSRGAACVVFVEQHPAVWQNLKGNLDLLASDGLGEVHCVKADAFHYLARAERPFDLVFVDPPYDLPDAMAQTLAGITQYSVLKDDGIVVYELRVSDRSVVPAGWDKIREKVYGQTRVMMLKYKKEDGL